MQSCGQGKIARLRTRHQLNKRQRREERQQEVGDNRKLEIPGSWKQQEVRDSRKVETAGSWR